MKHRFLSKLFIAVSWAGFIFMAIGIPLPPSHEEAGLTFYDKAIHIVLFAVFAYLLIWALKEKKYPRNKIYAIVFAAGFLYASFAEYYQLFVPTRSADIADLSAGTAGVVLAIVFDFISTYKPRPKMLLHICCIGCGAYVSQVLRDDYQVTLFFYNPNIFPQEEYDKRLEETKRIAKKFKVKIIEGEYDHKKWLAMVKGREADPEKGERCLLCYRDRLEATAELAREKGFKYFTTTLTISPHKDAKAVSIIGRELAEKCGVEFLDRDFKKKDGFNLSTKLSRELGLYRQEYCGCEFSRALSQCENCPEPHLSEKSV